MDTIARTPQPPYYAVIFTSLRSDIDDGYGTMAARMLELATDQPGFLGADSARESVGITVSYWRDLESIQRWKHHTEHCEARRLGREKWYTAFSTRICRVERDYTFDRSGTP
ncbi:MULTISPECIES: antibiotic biosynthesis monooxygenase [Microbulbifer]|uniref:antibiotic biosynthesis monooxygenase family protein n=1 Tax=Microbulbifer TaxID=48073 RepID=UPI001E42678D|nr:MULTISPECIES: antibiotic biosynthesis monooxygenase [Microbulbifer]UHQ56036.1 antibiotic biosynthesis monooxygenase [Microbulbifer sp. YPW16]